MPLTKEDSDYILSGLDPTKKPNKATPFLGRIVEASGKPQSGFSQQWSEKFGRKLGNAAWVAMRNNDLLCIRNDDGTIDRLQSAKLIESFAEVAFKDEGEQPLRQKFCEAYKAKLPQHCVSEADRKYIRNGFKNDKDEAGVKLSPRDAHNLLSRLCKATGMNDVALFRAITGAAGFNVAPGSLRLMISDNRVEVIDKDLKKIDDNSKGIDKGIINKEKSHDLIRGMAEALFGKDYGQERDLLKQRFIKHYEAKLPQAIKNQTSAERGRRLSERIGDRANDPDAAYTASYRL